MGTMHRMSGRSRLWTCNQGLWRDNKDMAGCGDRSLNLKMRVFVDTQSYWMRSIALPLRCEPQVLWLACWEKELHIWLRASSQKALHVESRIHRCNWWGFGELSHTWDLKQEVSKCLSSGRKHKFSELLFEVWRLAALLLHAQTL